VRVVCIGGPSDGQGVEIDSNAKQGQTHNVAKPVYSDPARFDYSAPVQAVNMERRYYPYKVESIAYYQNGQKHEHFFLVYAGLGIGDALNLLLRGYALNG
jgi:hypothetical protein